MREDIKSFVLNMQKPGRYTGGEQGSVIKNLDEVSLRWAFCFPDTYEIGMSNLGMRILRGVLNKLDRVWCESVYAPWLDMEKEMRDRGIPLFTQESGDSVGDFDIVAFTMQYEFCYSNVLNMLDLAGIPVKREDRGEEYPVIVAGGPCAYNPEPMSDFIDIFSIGEGEEAIPELAELYLKLKDSGRYTKELFLREAAHLKGFYVPSLYDVDYNDDGTVRYILPKYSDVPEKVVKRIVDDIDHTYVPTDTVVPYIETVHDRITLEVFRGCIRGCRFCQAGFVCRPVREKSPDVLCSLARETAELTGYDEISLSSLSISDYSQIEELTCKLVDWTDEKKINLSLPSLRADSITKELLDKVSGVRSSTLTFAPEAGSQRLRDIINKNITEDEILRAASLAYASGQTKVKLYFMNGLPGETYEDIEGIAELSHNVVSEYYRTPERNKKRQPQVTISVACFIPKPHTPFQWERQNTLEELDEKQKFLSSKITDRKVRYNYHDAKVSRLEAVFARGDRRLGRVIEAAHKEGIKFDAWDECFDYDRWIEIFEKCGIDPDFYANRDIPDDEILPWDMIDCGVTKEFLLSERHKAHQIITTPSCKDKCSGCGVTSIADKKYCRWCPGGNAVNNEKLPCSMSSEGKNNKCSGNDEIKSSAVQPVRTVRIKFKKSGALSYIGHLDLMRTVSRMIVRSGIPVWYTEGFNPKPKLIFCSPLSVGVEGERELVDVRITHEMSDLQILERLRNVSVPGLEILDVKAAIGKLSGIKWAENEIRFIYNSANESCVAEVNRLFKSPVIMNKKTKNGETETNICEYIKKLNAVYDNEHGELVVNAVTAAEDGRFLNPEYIARAVENSLGFKNGIEGYHKIKRLKLLAEDGVSEFA